MKHLFTLCYAILAPVIVTLVIWNYVPANWLDITAQNLGSTITTIQGSDTISASRSVINTNFANLNTDKLESGSTASALTIGTLTLTNDLTVANGGTGVSTFGGTNRILYTSAADTLASEAAFLYDQSLNKLTVDYASTTQASFSSRLFIPLNVVIGTDGEITADDTSGQFRFDSGSAERVIPSLYTIGFSFASTTLNTSTTTIYLAPARGQLTFVDALCDFNKHMGISLYDGTNRANFIIASSSIGTTTFSTNNTFNMGESIRVDVGTTTSANINVSGGCRFSYRYAAD
jgi:hypothetical protein